MSTETAFLELAAFRLVRDEGLRVLKAPAGSNVGPAWAAGWDDWDQVIVGEGAGVQPAIYAFKLADGMSQRQVKDLNRQLVGRVLSNPRLRQGPMPSVRVVAIFVMNSVVPDFGRSVTRMTPDQYYPGVKPQAWAADIGSGRLWSPKHFGIWPSRAERTTAGALQEMLQGRYVTFEELENVQTQRQNERAEFINRVRSNVPYVTYGLLAVLVLIFVLEYSSATTTAGGQITRQILLRFGALQPVRVERGEYWRLFTAMFVHVSVIHILFNGIALYSVGTLVERIYGHARYAFIYLVSGLGASIASYTNLLLVGGNKFTVAAGASGAIFGIAGVVIVLGVLRRSIVPRAIAIQLSVLMLILIVVNLGFDAFTPEIDIMAHVGGLAVGIVLGYLFAPRVPEVEQSIGVGWKAAK